MVASMLFSMLVFYLKMVHAETYTVGDERGWTYNLAGWTEGKHFKIGDRVVFKYDPRKYDVVVIIGNKKAYDECITPAETVVYNTGNDEFLLSGGVNYFISNIPGQCEAGLKLAIETE
ncbi:hypothetical protein TanjilG_00023 [Lupinus angustifolius]|uniref:Phytocyanin domain-containing protein n=1 Tax=Lupinus angustifolius TaxID=3871 RepID=A0A4P1QSU0_LUPAN|nr:PREDICTED: basic blue protein-like [Lupinus angustifolius]OIV94274.1 hypothetical protein TanjilG_00023 [Lupinus angustifolius]